MQQSVLRSAGDHEDSGEEAEALQKSKQEAGALSCLCAVNSVGQVIQKLQ